MKAPFYHVVVADKRRARDGRYIENVGYFNPVARGQAVRLELKKDRIDHWIAQGAQAHGSGYLGVGGAVCVRGVCGRDGNIVTRDAAAVALLRVRSHHLQQRAQTHARLHHLRGVRTAFLLPLLCILTCLLCLLFVLILVHVALKERKKERKKYRKKANEMR